MRLTVTRVSLVAHRYAIRDGNEKVGRFLGKRWVAGGLASVGDDIYDVKASGFGTRIALTRHEQEEEVLSAGQVDADHWELGDYRFARAPSTLLKDGEEVGVIQRSGRWRPKFEMELDDDVPLDVAVLIAIVQIAIAQKQVAVPA